jgi:hypothetical protein
LAVNGVTFQAFSDLPGFGNSFDNSTGSGSFASPGTSDANYNTLLTSGAFGNTGGSYTVNWSGMTPGNSYLVELWVNDGRNSSVNQRTETITGGANTSDFLAYGSGDSGPGQYIIGTFVADSSRAETLTLTPGAAIPSAQLNLLQVRDITPKPNVTWQTPVTISGASDVSTLGSYFGSWAPQDGSANTFPVNGVTFQGFSDLPFLTAGPTLDNGYNGFVSTTPDANYNTLLQYASFSNEGSTPATFSWSGMTPGHTYLVQFWVNDGRTISPPQSRTETITGGANTSAPLSYGSDGSGLGQYVLGTFVANSSGGQTLTLTASSTGANPSAQINLLQVRDITPPRITGVAVSGPTLTIMATNCPTKGAYVLLQNANVTLPLAQWTPVFTNSFDGSGGINLSTNVVNPSNPREFYILRTQ